MVKVQYPVGLKLDARALSICDVFASLGLSLFCQYGASQPIVCLHRIPSTIISKWQFFDSKDNDTVFYEIRLSTVQLLSDGTVQCMLRRQGFLVGLC